VSARQLRPSADAVLALGLAALLVLLAFTTSGGLDQDVAVSTGNTWAEIVITLLGAGACAAALVLAPPRGTWGGTTLALFALLAAFTALSITWSVQPDDSWQAANLTLSYLAAFAGAMALARLMRGRWRGLLGAIAIACVALSGYALLAKVFPGSLAAADTLGRLIEPMGYWNAIGVVAALGLVPCLWAWSRRDGSALVRGLTFPAVAVLTSVAILSYSRSAVLVAVLGVACWFAFVPGRLRGAVLLAPGVVGAAVITGWALGHSALTSDGVALPDRTSAGHTFGAVCLVTVVLLALAGVLSARATDQIAVGEDVRRRIGTVLIVLVALLPVAGVVGLAESSRGLTGEISHAWNSLTSDTGGVGNGVSRFGQLGSSRPRYWREGIRVGEHALFKGVGALGYFTARTRYTTDAAVVVHAHSYIVQTFADFGLLGLAINLALLIAWGLAAARAVGGRARWNSLDGVTAAERAGLVAMLIVVVVFGVQSAIDWTWFFPGVAVPALLCAGWLAGRGPLLAGAPETEHRAGSILDRPATAAGVTLLIAVALAGAWLIWQPLRSARAASSAVSAAARRDLSAAFADARAAKSEDPLALQPLFVLAELYQAIGDDSAARSQLLAAVSLQPQNYSSWLELGNFYLGRGQPRLALPALRRALTLAPVTVPAIGEALAKAEAAAK
jgi:hypothetical protein